MGYTGAGLEGAYGELGLEEGADISDVKRAFRHLARECHPDLCGEEELAGSYERFIRIKEAYDEVMAAAGCGGSRKQRPRQRVAVTGRTDRGFSRNMVQGAGHHKVSDGRSYDLWLDLRAGGLDNAKQEVMTLFWKTRSVVDELGVSLVKEGVVSAVLTDDPAALPDDVGEVARKLIAGWDRDWMPLIIHNNQTGLLSDAATGEGRGWLRPATPGRLLSPVAGSAAPPGQDPMVGREANDLVVSVRDAAEAERMQSRYQFVMCALALPPDPASWAVAASTGIEAETAMDVAFSMSGKAW